MRTHLIYSSRVRHTLTGLLFTTAVFLAGCGMGTPAAPTAKIPGSYSLGAIKGIAHGGLQPVVGATVKIYATQNNNYGGNGLLLAEANDQDGGTQGDGYDTDTNGNFLFSAGNYVAGCPAGQYAYITISGGDAGGGTNSDLLLMAVLGSCSAIYNTSGNGETYSGSTPVFVDEVSTVAAAYALGNFMSVSGSASPYTVNISTPVSNNFSDGTVAWNGSAYATCTGTACNGKAAFSSGTETTQLNGLYHAVLNYQNLVSLTTGQAKTGVTTSLSGATGTIPAAEINTIANALQLCVNSAGGSSSNCTNLFSYTPAPGGTAPGNTLQAAMNLAKNPYSSSSNVANLYSFQTPQSLAYSPALSAAPPDWTLTIVYAGGTLNLPYYLALDANDAVYIANQGTGNNVVAIASNGAFLSGTAGWTATGLTNPHGIAADSLGNIFVTNDVQGSDSTTPQETYAGTYEFTNTGTFVTNIQHVYSATGNDDDPISFPFSVAVSKRNDVWVSYADDAVGDVDWWQCTLNSGSCTYSSASITGNVATVSDLGFTNLAIDNPYGIAIDANQNIWVEQNGLSSTSNDLTATLVNYYAGTPATYPVYDNSTTAGSSTYAYKKLYNSLSASPCSNQYAYASAFDSSGNAYVSMANTAAAGAICKIAPTVNNSTAQNITSTTVTSLITTVAGAQPEGSEVDGSGMLWVPQFYANNNTNYSGAPAYANFGLLAYNLSGTQLSQPTNGFSSCYVNTSTYACTAGSSSAAVNTGLSISNPRYVGIDSTGSIWLTEYNGKTITQTIGIAAPTVPLLAAGAFGVKP